MDRAIGRIEAALTRIDRAADKRLVDTADAGRGADAMRQRVAAALEELDTLIEGLER